MSERQTGEEWGIGIPFTESTEDPHFFVIGSAIAGEGTDDDGGGVPDDSGEFELKHHAVDFPGFFIDIFHGDDRIPEIGHPRCTAVTDEQGEVDRHQRGGDLPGEGGQRLQGKCFRRT